MKKPKDTTEPKATHIRRNHTGHRVGETHGRAKLSDVDVREMRKKYMAYVVGYRALAREYGCGVSTVRDIVNYCTRP